MVFRASEILPYGFWTEASGPAVGPNSLLRARLGSRMVSVYAEASEFARLAVPADAG